MANHAGAVVLAAGVAAAVWLWRGGQGGGAPHVTAWRVTKRKGGGGGGKSTLFRDLFSGRITDLFGGVAGSGGTAPAAGVIPASYPVQSPGAPGVGGLLALIGSVEAPQGYNQVWGGIRAADHPPRRLTSMTVGQVLDWQDSIDPLYPSEAAGRYQILEDTLRGLVARGVVRRGDRFNAATQDRLAVALMRGRGLDRFMSGSISADAFANNLAKEWASLPVVSGRGAGRSYYDKDGLNRSLVTPGQVLGAIRGIA